MKAPDLYFDESTSQFQLDDDWFASTEEKISQTPLELKQTKNDTVVNGSNKFGLGFSGKVVEKDSDAFEQRLKNKKRKKSDNENEMDQHGIMEDTEISRTSLSLSKKNTKNDSNVQKSATKVVSNKDKNTDSNKSNSHPPNIPLDKPSTIQASKSNKDKSLTLINTTNDEADTTTFKKKKKRSKQKNIRKDTRTMDQKPEHLRPGENFRGRPLTQETLHKLQHNTSSSSSYPVVSSLPITATSTPKSNSKNKKNSKNKNNSNLVSDISNKVEVEVEETLPVEWSLDYGKK
eukprot:gene4503-8955_t